ncbi:hypothetical protein DRN58_00685 [Thermococci archaeon]|nr:MAG: hypothetical protein DRN41_00285 [Thermococci archaeon]RLG01937.1 MAG: hypothetical protein DRN58_00685 [Thermococci archaeon]
MATHEIVIIGIGNILRSDDGLGFHIIKELQKYNLPPDVKLVERDVLDFQILSVMENARKVIFVDAIQNKGKPGKIYYLDLTQVNMESAKDLRIPNIHNLELEKFLLFCKIMGVSPPKILLIGCEPKNLEMGLELSKEVREAIPKIINLILKELEG